MSLTFPNGEPFTIGEAAYQYRPATAHETHPRLILDILVEGIATRAMVDKSEGRSACPGLSGTPVSPIGHSIDFAVEVVGGAVAPGGTLNIIGVSDLAGNVLSQAADQIVLQDAAGLGISVE
ncbi:MAG: hypothetical protein ETSY2_29790 [Candidatus Entotheonella gemina]|uniref:Uncharacterized protein n=1 Tax=Candidatus Entotheonella gemina TaxID=1429439 RepID=W4M270_9BACT|nr:MAG: hypothetical protein ETSY2_29790 [Candidatus Entotheonella gemina]